MRRWWESKSSVWFFIGWNFGILMGGPFKPWRWLNVAGLAACVVALIVTRHTVPEGTE